LHCGRRRDITRIVREIVFDTETTGLEPQNGDRIIEIGCVELLNHIPTGRTFHRYINPGRPVSAAAGEIHGLTDEFLRGQHRFEEIAAELADFIGDSVLVAHNAGFDRDFVNMELGLCGRMAIAEHRFVDTLLLARRRHPNGPNSLDALCARYGIDNSARTRHGALLDAEILAGVYLELLGGRQATLAFGVAAERVADAARIYALPPRPRPLPPRLTAEDERLHAAFLADLGASPLWLRYAAPPPLQVAV
jgi:DNA polymerase-3 subunit epsilon